MLNWKKYFLLNMSTYSTKKIEEYKIMSVISVMPQKLKKNLFRAWPKIKILTKKSSSERNCPPAFLNYWRRKWGGGDRRWGGGKTGPGDPPVFGPSGPRTSGSNLYIKTSRAQQDRSSVPTTRFVFVLIPGNDYIRSRSLNVVYSLHPTPEGQNILILYRQGQNFEFDHECEAS